MVVRPFDLFLLAALAGLTGLGVARGVMLYARGVRVVVVDRERSLAHGLADLAQLFCLVFWAYEVVAYAWPLATWRGPAWLEIVLVDAVWSKAAGMVVLLVAFVLYATALRSFGDSWRLGIDRERPGVLVTGGIFGWTRNPIYLSLDLFGIGAFLMQGRLVLLLLALTNAGLFHQLIRREERFLAGVYGDAYRDYCKCVGRYVTL